MTAPVIRALEAGDYAQWLPLWIANNQGEDNPDINAHTWRLLIDPDSAIHGFGAWSGGDLAGFVHAVTHPVTGHLQPACYMQDLFVDPAFRRQGIALTLVTALSLWARQAHCARLYWLAEAKNEAAQRLYATIGLKLDFTFHIMPL